MAHYNYTPLSPQDMDFLLWETPALPMHGSGVQLYDAGPLARDDGGIDFETLKRAYAAVLHHLPRYRQKLAWVPGERRAVWVDDGHFNLDYHMRHIGLPRPGSEAQLKRLGARIMEQPLDRGRPLWEVWVIEGLDGGRFATLSKTHHCMIDGASGMDLMLQLLSREPGREIPDAPRFVPRPAPSPAELRRSVRRYRRHLPLRALSGLRDFARETEDVFGEVRARAQALGELARWKLVPASETPLNGPVGPHRAFDWLDLRLDDVKAVRKERGCSVNDVVLAIVAGAMREYLAARGERPDDLDFRVAAPVNVRSEADRGRPGNRVSSWVLRLPVDEPDPLRRLEAVQRSTRALKDSKQAVGVEMMTALHEWVPFDIQAAQRGTVNLFVTNVPGPQFPLHLAGCRLLAQYAQPPLIDNLGLVVSAMSYDGRIFWGLVADCDRVPDLDRLTALVGRSFEELARAAGVAPA